MIELPRLTTALRAYPSLAKAPSPEPVCGGAELRARRRVLRRERSGLKELTWERLSSAVKDAQKQRSGDDGADAALKDLRRVASELVGSERDSEVVSGAAVFLYETFSDVSVVSQGQAALMKTHFGACPEGACSRALAAARRVRNCLPDGLPKPCRQDGEMEAEFGLNLKYVPPSTTDNSAADDNSSDAENTDDDSDVEGGISIAYTAPPGNGDAAALRSAGDDRTGDSWSWLRMEVRKRASPEAVDGLCSSVYDILSSSRADEALQNELFDLLGFDHFDFIQEVIARRSDVVASALLSTTRAVARGGVASRMREMGGRPVYGCQVTVQSEQEKLMKRQMRREEKRQLRGRDDWPLTEDDDRMDSGVGGLPFDIEHLRLQREQQLLAASRAPLQSFASSSLPRYTQPERYPFVFDSLAEAKLSASFIAGAKLLLPADCEKKSNKMYEEVSLPASTQKPPPDVGSELISVASMDEIGKLAFRGTKQLNRIQTVVFETASQTNENLLICAPTGAGKTNIAMLTILRELRQHVGADGKIRTNEFKIVYVAPMKALAAEMVRNFGKRLEPLGIAVRELTGDMQLTKKEILSTQMLVTTPEKWDVVTRKSTGDVALAQLVRLLIIDEVHLLHDDRGAVIESLVARTLRQVETTQSMIRIVGLSATLPNYTDVARFLRVNPYIGLFFFDGRFRPVPLQQTFVGVKALGIMQQIGDMNKVCYDKVLEQVRLGEQVMVFVHARNETVRTATTLCEIAKNNGDITFFQANKDASYGDAEKQVMKSRNKPLRELFPDGFAMHHAGMLRCDRNLVEKYFADGHIRCLVCTATLAWGVNLPAHAVVIKGTQIYDAKKGSFVDLGVLDVLQIFGRAGRPQYDTSGMGTIITTHDKLGHYLALLTRQNPIESQFTQSLTDNLNAEISLGTVTNVDEAVKWLSYTYLFVRMRCNPLAYGVPYQERETDPQLEKHRRKLIVDAGRKLDRARMVRFNEQTGLFAATDLGRTASHYYIKYDTIEVINEFLREAMNEADVLAMISKAQEFDQIKVRDEEADELTEHMHECPYKVAGGTENTYGKVNVLLQTHVSRRLVDNFSLVTDMAYVAQNAARIVRALFEITLRKGWAVMSGRLLTLSKVVEHQLWSFVNPINQFPDVPPDVLRKIDAAKLTVDRMREMDEREIGLMIRHEKMGGLVKRHAFEIPRLFIEAVVQPITRTVLQIKLLVTPEFRWNDRAHGGAETFWLWVEDPETNNIYHTENISITKKQAITGEPLKIVFTIPIFEPLPSQYLLRASSDRWLGSDTVTPLSFKHLILPERHPPHTELLDLRPLPVSALGDERLEQLYKFTHFNPVQTQIFHTLYHTDCNVLLGAPTGSGKTVAAEMAIFRLFREYPGEKAVYIAPLKALVRERMDDWKVRIEQRLGKRVVELTGDVSPDMRAIASADLIVTTPEKWDGISRSWQNRAYVQSVTLVVIDEIHLLGADRGPVLEVVVSRTNFISANTKRPVRIVGLSTALANARDLANWLGIKQMGLFNFRPSVRPVPLEVHIAGFPGKHYCPRMATMNKPAFQAIKTHSPSKPVLIFVSSRRQTRLTALDLIAFLAAEENPKQWLHMPEHEMESVAGNVREANLKLTLAFGIGIHHAGLHERDRAAVEELFVNQKIQVLVATSTLAWGVNFPAHLVIVKGTEYFDGKLKRYVDFPITDVLQMMGRAGRPQFDDHGVAVILVHDVKKHFYKKFLYEPFPVESSLLEVLSDHLNAEIVAGTINSKQEAMEYITWTYFFRRLVMNPSFYNLEGIDHDVVNKFLSVLVEKSLRDLEASHCIFVGDDNMTLTAETTGRVASYYYLRHQTVRLFYDVLKRDLTVEQLIRLLADAHEYAELPVRHNEDELNGELASQLPLSVDSAPLDDSHTKAFLLLQAHFERHPLPSADYLTDLKSVLDQSLRIAQAVLDMSADAGWLATSLRVCQLVQALVQGRWTHESSLLTLPHFDTQHVRLLSRISTDAVKSVPRGTTCGSGGGSRRVTIDCLPQLVDYVGGSFERLSSLLHGASFTTAQLKQIFGVLQQLPALDVRLAIKGLWPGIQRVEERPATRGVDEAGASSTSDGRPALTSVHWHQVLGGQEMVLLVSMAHVNKVITRHVHAPQFPKPKDEGWILVLGCIDSGELLALKRCAFSPSATKATVSFVTPNQTGRVIYTLYIMSDSYMGLDQQYDIGLDVVASGITSSSSEEPNAD